MDGRGFAAFRSGGGWSCLLDRCPHRAARLSDGHLVAGKLACGYHGWCFDGAGHCVEIPQLAPGLSIPNKAKVPVFPVRQAQGMLWLWAEQAPEPDEEPPTIAELDRSDCRSIDFAIELPYEQSFLIENVIDIAHIHVAHHGVRGGGYRDLAAPLEFAIRDRGQDGFEASFHSLGPAAGGGALRGATVRFVAPNLVHYRSHYVDDDLVSGLALYSLPLAPNRCRLLYRAYSNFWPLRDRWRPRWLEHFAQCTLLEQDLAVVLGQVEEMRQDGRPARAQWLPIKSSDALVVAYRRWLDHHQVAPGPASLGLDRLAPRAGNPPGAYDRFRMHARICGSCGPMQARLARLSAPLGLGVVALLALAAAASGTAMATGAAALAVALSLGRHAVARVERRFHGPWRPER